MRRKLIVMLVTLVCICAGSATALAAPNGDHASCEAILTSPDAHDQFRDDTAREFTTAGVSRPGEIMSAAARAPGTTEEECQASSPG